MRPFRLNNCPPCPSGWRSSRHERVGLFNKRSVNETYNRTELLQNHNSKIINPHLEGKQLDYGTQPSQCDVRPCCLCCYIRAKLISAALMQHSGPQGGFVCFIHGSRSPPRSMLHTSGAIQDAPLVSALLVV